MDKKDLQKKLSDKLKEFEKDKDNRIGILLELEQCDNYELGLTQMIEYLDNPNTSKTRNDIIEEAERIVTNSKNYSGEKWKHYQDVEPLGITIPLTEAEKKKVEAFEKFIDEKIAIEELENKVKEELKKHEKDETNRIGMIKSLQRSDNYFDALMKLYSYLIDSTTSKTRDSIFRYIFKLRGKEIEEA